MKKVLGLLSPFYFTDSQGDFPGLHLGVRVACLEFQKNVIQHGGFDCCHFLLGRDAHSDEEIAGYIRSQGWDPERILIYDGPLPLDRLAGNGYHAIHRPDLYLHEILALRHTVNSPLAPATAMNHTLSYAVLMSQWMELLLGHVLPCDAIVCTSVASRDVITNSFGLLSERLSAQLGAKVPPFAGRLEIIPLGVDAEYWRPEENKAAVKREFGLPEQACVILCPGRFSTHDKMDLRPFLIAVRRLLSILGSDQFRVVLVGDDPKGGISGAKLIRDFVEKFGLTQVVKIDTDGSPSRMRQYYRAADIFVSLVDNLQETFGLTVIQAMACGLPAVVSDWNGYKDTVVHGETGIRVQTYWSDCDRQISDLGQQRPWMTDQLLLAQSVSVDIDVMVRALYSLAVNPDLRSRWGKAGRRRAEELFAWPVVIGRYRELWDECHEMSTRIDRREWLRANHSNILSPHYFRQFSHYPTEIISPETPLVLVPSGAQLVSSGYPTEEVFLPAVMKHVFSPGVFQALVSRLGDWPVAFGPLVEDVSARTGHPQDLVARQVMWLMKYGAVKPAKTVEEALAESGAGREEAAEPVQARI